MRDKLRVTFPRSCQHVAAVSKRSLSPNALHYRVLGKRRVSVRADEKDPEGILL